MSQSAYQRLYQETKRPSSAQALVSTWNSWRCFSLFFSECDCWRTRSQKSSCLLSNFLFATHSTLAILWINQREEEPQPLGCSCGPSCPRQTQFLDAGGLRDTLRFAFKCSLASHRAPRGVWSHWWCLHTTSSWWISLLSSRDSLVTPSF